VRGTRLRRTRDRGRARVHLGPLLTAGGLHMRRLGEWCLEHSRAMTRITPWARLMATTAAASPAETSPAGSTVRKTRSMGTKVRCYRAKQIMFSGSYTYGPEATEANRRLVGGQMVHLEFDIQPRDQYGRLLAYVYVGEMMVNAELVRQGSALLSTYPPNVKHEALFVRPQREAREATRGLWGP
jgi:hypothetical protein